MRIENFSLKWKLILWLVVIGFITSLFIHLILVIIGTSEISYSAKQSKIIQWQYDSIQKPIETLVATQQTLASTHYSLKELVLTPEWQALLATLISPIDNKAGASAPPYTKIKISGLAIIDHQSQLITQYGSSNLKLGDVGAQLPIYSRDDLSDALSNRNNTGIEALSDDHYLVIRPISGKAGNILGATISWQSWQIDQQQAPLYYISLTKALSYALIATLSSFIWILPSTFILGWLVASILGRRYHKLYKTIEAWGEGQLEQRIPVKGKDEVALSFQRLNQMAEKLSERENLIRNLSSIEERQNLAAELHDTVKQQLFGSNLLLATASEQIQKNDGQAKLTIEQAISQNQKAFEQVNNLIFTLSPINIGSDLESALTTAIEKWAENNPQKLDYSINLQQTSQQLSLSEVQQQTVFRSIMEALQNISKHSSATQVTVKLDRQPNELVWSVEDNGELTSQMQTKQDDTALKFGQGLNLMKQRINSVNGELAISVSNGFKLSARLPL